MKLYPRLPSRFAAELFMQQTALPLDEIQGAVSHPYTIWPATGAARVTNHDLEHLGSRLRAVAKASGFPASLGRAEHAELDIALARTLWEASELSPVEAGFPDVWSFLALVLVPDVVWWRAAGSTNVERFVATDLTRHTLARLWWRAHLFTFGLDNPEEGWNLWRSTEIGEAELDQIQTRRGGYGRSPRAFRALVRAYPFAILLADEAGVDRRTFWRQRYLRWILRLGAFINFAGMPEDELDHDLRVLLGETVSGSAISATDDAGVDPERAAVRETEVSADEAGTSFDALPLSSLVVHLTEAVRAAGAVPGEDLVTAFERASGITVPPRRAEILNGVAWQARTLRYVVLDDSSGRPVWRSGTVLPAPDRRWRDWSIESFTEHVRASNGTLDLTDLCAELFAGRAGATVKRIARGAMREARG
jgi:hypothetical protein